MFVLLCVVPRGASQGPATGSHRGRRSRPPPAQTSRGSWPNPSPCPGRHAAHQCPFAGALDTRTRLARALQPPSSSWPPPKTCFQDKTSHGQGREHGQTRGSRPAGHPSDPLSLESAKLFPRPSRPVPASPDTDATGSPPLACHHSLTPVHASWPLPLRFPLPATPSRCPSPPLNYSPGPTPLRTTPITLAAISGVLAPVSIGPLPSCTLEGTVPPPISQTGSRCVF